MKPLLFIVVTASAFAASDPTSPTMLSGPWLPEDPHQLDFDALPRVPGEHVVINDVHAPDSSRLTLDKKKGGVNQHNYLAHHDGQFGPCGAMDRASRIAWDSA